MIVVSDSTPLISLALVNQLELLHELYGKVLIPQAVYVEVVDQGGYRAGAVEVARAGWLSMEVVSIDSLNRVTPRSSQLHQGEIEAIALALQLKADVVLMMNSWHVSWRCVWD